VQVDIYRRCWCSTVGHHACGGHLQCDAALLRRFRSAVRRAVFGDLSSLAMLKLRPAGGGKRHPLS
jgi:hypothetical protein